MPAQKGEAMDRIAPRAVATAGRTLRDAELWATMASLLGGVYPHLALTTIGSLIGEGGWSLTVGDEPSPELAELLAGCRTAHDQALDIRTRALAHIASHANTNGQGQPVIVFNAALRPRSGTVWIHHDWPGPGVRGIAVLDEWDRLVQPALDDVVRNPDGSIAGAWVGWPARDVPSVGYRTFHLVPESVTPRRDQLPVAEISRPPYCQPEPPPPTSAAELEPPPVDPPLRVQPASRQTGHLPQSFSLLNLQPADSVIATRVSLTADGVIRVLLREVAGQHCRAELRLFVPFPDNVQTVDLAPRQLATVTGLAEPPAWAGPGPALAPTPDPAEPATDRDNPSQPSDLAVTIPDGGITLVPGSGARLDVTVTGPDDGPVTVQALAPCTLWPLLVRWEQYGTLTEGKFTTGFDLAAAPNASPVRGWIAIRAGRPGQDFSAPRPVGVTVTALDE
jgi:hypothetical protein